MKHLFKCITAIAVFSLFSSCKKDWNELGSQLIANDSIITLSFDSLKIKASIHREDSLSSLNTNTSFVGSIYDENFGASSASIYTEFRLPSSNVTFGEFPVADSLVLSLDLNDYYGDTLSTIQLEVVEMLEQITTSETDSLGEENSITIYTHQDFERDNQILSSLTFNPNPESNSIVTLALDNSFAQSFLDADSLNFVDNDAFQNFFNGLYISCQQVSSDGALLEFDLLSENSNMTLYYHNSESDSLSYTFQINSNADRMTRWNHDYSSTEINTLFGVDSITTAYVQGGAGLRTYIELPSLNSLKDSNYVVHKAELSLPYISTVSDSLFPIPSKLGLAAINSEGNLELLTEDQNEQGSTYFDGNVNVLDNMYQFNIARYVHKVIEEDYTNKLAIYVPSSVLNPERVLLYNSTENNESIRLKLFVSKQ